MNSWANGNDSILRLKIVKAEHADDFLQRGSIKFSTPNDWVEYAEKHTEGRGDFYEGTMAYCNKEDKNTLCEFMQKYSSKIDGEIYTKQYGNRIFLKNRKSMQLPGYCLYLIKVEDLAVPEKAGRQELTADVSGQYFKDFADNKTYEEVLQLPNKDQPAMIVIEDLGKFRERLHTALKNIGIKDSQILEFSIEYKDFDEKPFDDFKKEYPMELFVKHKRFIKQHEGRIIINTSDHEILARLKEPIELGDMSDIAKVKKGYFPEGIKWKFDFNVEECK